MKETSGDVRVYQELVQQLITQNTTLQEEVDALKASAAPPAPVSSLDLPDFNTATLPELTFLSNDVLHNHSNTATSNPNNAHKADVNPFGSACAGYSTANTGSTVEPNHSLFSDFDEEGNALPRPRTCAEIGLSVTNVQVC